MERPWGGRHLVLASGCGQLRTGRGGLGFFRLRFEGGGASECGALLDHSKPGCRVLEGCVAAVEDMPLVRMDGERKGV